MSDSKIKYIELFAGIGGFRCGLEKASSRFECVFANEWDRYASLVYKNHYGSVDTRDITTVPTSDIPDHDLLVGACHANHGVLQAKEAGLMIPEGICGLNVLGYLEQNSLNTSSLKMLGGCSHMMEVGAWKEYVRNFANAVMQ